MPNEKSILIESLKCIKCGKCAQVCPARIMTQTHKNSEIALSDPQGCIACGHCVDVCPNNSIQHSLFPSEKRHPIDRSQLPTPEQLMLLIKSRRSNRAITPKPIPREKLNLIVEAARYAPTASNKQQVSVSIINDPQKLLEISNLTFEMFQSIARKLNNPLVRLLLKPLMKELYKMMPSIVKVIQEHQKGNDPILRKGTALLVFHTPQSNLFGCEDANLAYQNASLMAESLGVSQIYMGFVIRTIKQGNRKKFAQITGIDGTVQAIMSLGIPAFTYDAYTER